MLQFNVLKGACNNPINTLNLVKLKENEMWNKNKAQTKWVRNRCRKDLLNLGKLLKPQH